MKAIDQAPDLAGRMLAKGDTVATLTGHASGKIWALADDDGVAFVQLKPVHQPYAQPVWHASDQVIWVATPKQRDADDSAEKTDAKTDNKSIKSSNLSEKSPAASAKASTASRGASGASAAPRKRRPAARKK